MTLIYCEWHLIPRWILRSIFTRFPKQLLKDLVSWGSPGELSMIGCSSRDALDVSSWQFWSTVLQCSARLPIHTFKYWTVKLVVLVYHLGVCLSVTLHIVDLWQYYVCCTRSGVIRCTIFIGTHRYTYAQPRCRTLQHRMTYILQWNDFVEWFWWPRIQWGGTGGFKERMQCLHIGLADSSIFCLLLFSLSLLSFYGLVLCGLGLWTDRVLSALSQPCIANLF